MYRYKPAPESRLKTVLLVAVAFAAGFIVNAVLVQQLVPGESSGENNMTPTSYEPVTKGTTAKSNGFSTEMVILAVDSQRNGVAADLGVEARPGTGKVLTNIDQLIFIADTQESIQIARDVAANYTGRDTSSVDIVYSITVPNNVSVVGGPSAGAALAVATIAALENKDLKNNITVTGTVSPDGAVGRVGGILEKAKAAKSRGITLFLVPAGEGTETSVKPIKSCQSRPGFEYCEITYERSTVNVGEAIGIEIKEIASVQEAAKYFGL